MTDDLLAALADERRALADQLAPLTAEQWEQQSLCSAWTVKGLAVHLLPGAGTGMGEFLRAVVRARGNVHRASEALNEKYTAAMSTGSADVVSGPASALALALTGRTARLDELDGPGAEELRRYASR